jgi:peptidoglycan-associated lipoprotein
MNALRLLGIGMCVILAFAGCGTKQQPDPALTAVGLPAGGGAGGDDWLNPMLVDGRGAAGGGSDLGLEGRSGAGTANMQRVENLFTPVLFDFDQSFVRPEFYPVLQQVYDYLRQNTATRLLIEGHCDWRGTTEYNMALGDRRANSVRAYLEQLGVPASRVETVSKGDLEASANADEAQMRKERRAALIILR